MTLELRKLVTHFAQPGRIEAIVIRPLRLTEAVFVSQAHAVPGRGLLGDHRAEKLREQGEATKRELTLIQHEHLPLISAWSMSPEVDARQLRRNLVVSGVNLLAMRSPFPGVPLIWQIGDQVLVEITGPCAPCSRMEKVLGPGGYSAMRGHGGMTARLITGGAVRVGDAVMLAPANV